MAEVVDVVDEKLWNIAVSEIKDIADKWRALFNLTRFPNGKERMTIELWLNKGEKK